MMEPGEIAWIYFEDFEYYLGPKDYLHQFLKKKKRARVQVLKQALEFSPECYLVLIDEFKEFVAWSNLLSQKPWSGIEGPYAEGKAFLTWDFLVVEDTPDEQGR